MHTAAVWLRQAGEHHTEPIKVDWRYFSLEQVNTADPDGPKVWEKQEEEATSLVAFKAAEAARVFDTFRQIVAGDLNIQEIKRPKR